MMPRSDMPDLAGIFPPIPTPFDEDERIDLVRLSENLERWEQEPLDGYVVGGSNGEFVSLSPDERLEVVGHVCAKVGAEKLVIAGSGLHSTRETILQTEAMAKLGAQAALVVTPGYYKSRMDERALIAHYTRVADHAPVPIILYNVPANTGINMNADTIVLLSKHANIIGLKDSAGDVAKIAEITQRAPEGFQVLAGSASFLLGALAVGAVGTISALANLAGRDLSELMQAFEKGDLERAKNIQQRLVRPNSAVTVRFGVAGLKAALDLIRFYGGPPRSPLQALDDGQRAQVKQILEESELLPPS
jgi:4-hydroxy-2-oxoglutarate aldolase